MKAVQKWLNLLIVADSDDGTVGAWPCVGAEMWLAGYATTACCLWDEGITLAERGVECLYYQFLQCLIVCYKYTFHNFIYNFTMYNVQFIFAFYSRGGGEASAHPLGRMGALLELLLSLVLLPVVVELTLLLKDSTLALHTVGTKDTEH